MPPRGGERPETGRLLGGIWFLPGPWESARGDSAVPLFSARRLHSDRASALPRAKGGRPGSEGKVQTVTSNSVCSSGGDVSGWDRAQVTRGAKTLHLIPLVCSSILGCDQASARTNFNYSLAQLPKTNKKSQCLKTREIFDI